MSSNNSGAVFFLGTRAHYQVLQQPETRSYDVENGNASTETIYQNPSVQELWPADQVEEYVDEGNWNCYDNTEVSNEKGRTEMGNGVKRRHPRRQSEATLCEKDNEMGPALLNGFGDSSTAKPKSSRGRMSLMAFLSSLARRKRRLNCGQMHYLKHLESTLSSCSYRESCRCLDCQSRYFECDESEGYNSDDSGFTPPYVTADIVAHQQPDQDDDDDEVFVDTVPGDNTSTDLLIEGTEPAKMSVSSDEIEIEEDDDMQLEVVAGTPIFLNYLLTHPMSCAIQ